MKTKQLFNRALYIWTAFTALIVFQVVRTYLRHGADGFNIFIQQGPFTHLPITLASVALTWLLFGLLLWLSANQKINSTNWLPWVGFFLIAFLYLNILRERHRYGDIEYYIEAGRNLLNNQALPDTYLYPPFWATLLELLLPTGEDAVLLIAWLLNVLSLFLFYFLLQRILERYGFTSKVATLVTILFMLVNMPLLRTLMYVQVNLHVINLVFLSLLSYPKRPFLSALALAVAVHFKASPAVLVLAFLLERDWRWIGWFSLHMVLITAFTVAIDGVSPYFDFVNNFLTLNAPRDFSFHDSSFDSTIGVTLSFLRIDSAVIRILVYIAKAGIGMLAFWIALRSIRSRAFYHAAEGRGNQVFNAMIPLSLLMTFAPPLIWEHHGVFLTLPFLVMLKQLDTSTEWIWFGTAYFLQFIVPTFDFFPWSYSRLVGMLIIFWLVWVASRKHENGSPLFRRINDQMQNLSFQKLIA